MQLQLGTLGAWGGGRSGRDLSRMEGGTIVGTGDSILEEDSGDGFHVSSRCAGARAELCGVLGSGPQPGTEGQLVALVNQARSLAGPDHCVMGGHLLWWVGGHSGDCHPPATNTVILNRLHLNRKVQYDKRPI